MTHQSRGKRKQRAYSDAERAAAMVALRANGGNLDKTSRETTIPESTLRWWRDSKPTADAQAAQEKYAGDLAAYYDALAWKLLNRVEWDMNEIPAGMLMTAAAIATDKSRLLRGQPTVIAEQRADDYSGISTEELRRRHDELKRRLGGDGAGVDAPGPGGDSGGAGPAPPGGPGATPVHH